MEQATAFLKGEGKAWLKRNEARIPIENDLVIGALRELVGHSWVDHSILEIGCSNGWRLEQLGQEFGFNPLHGVEPSGYAAKQARAKGIHTECGFAHSLPFPEGYFNVVIYGFCLYLVDRSTLFQVVAEGDRVLRDGGLMIIYDFAATMPHRVPYKHKEGLWSYKQDYAQLFTANPAYRRLLTKVHLDGQTQAVVLKKSIEWGWPSVSVSSD